MRIKRGIRGRLLGGWAYSCNRESTGNVIVGRVEIMRGSDWP